MITKNEFVHIMNSQSEIALATSIDTIPNVRIVNFYFESTTNTLFFTTFGDNDKVKEFEENPNIAFTTVPHNGTAHVKAKGIVKKSDRKVSDVAEAFISKIPDYKETIELAGNYLVLYEIKFISATVTLDFENIDVITICEK